MVPVNIVVVGVVFMEMVAVAASMNPVVVALSAAIFDGPLPLQKSCPILC